MLRLKTVDYSCSLDENSPKYDDGTLCLQGFTAICSHLCELLQFVIFDTHHSQVTTADNRDVKTYQYFLFCYQLPAADKWIAELSSLVLVSGFKSDK
jgi:hypothetical protein